MARSDDREGHRRRSTTSIRTRLICPECSAENFVNLRKLTSDEVLCVCGAKIDVSLEKYALTSPGRDPDKKKGSYPRFLGRYKLLRLLGAGGQGNVHLGLDTLGRKVAVKEFIGSAADWKKTLNEARCSMRCSCLNVVNTYDILEEERTIVQEFVDGETLRRSILSRQSEKRRIGEPLFQIDQLLDIFLGILRGMMVAHFRGVIHLDLKPENVIIDSAGGMRLPKVSDFGLARNLMEEGDRSISGERILARSAGDQAFHGTPAYAAPEQIDPKQKHLISARTDIYQLGVVFYELVSGRLPFEGKGWADIFASILEWTPVRLRERPVDFPEALLAIQEKMSAQAPEDRYSSLTDVIDDLEAWRAQRHVHEYKRVTKGRSRARGFILFFVGILIGGVIGLLPSMKMIVDSRQPQVIPEEDIVRAGILILEQSDRATSEVEKEGGSIVVAREQLRRASSQFRVLKVLVPDSEIVDRIEQMLHEAEQLIEEQRRR